VKAEPEQDVVMIDPQVVMNDDGQLFMQQDNGVISDRDEILGEEYEYAVKSPPKAMGIREKSDVSFSICLLFIIFEDNMVQAWVKAKPHSKVSANATSLMAQATSTQASASLGVSATMSAPTATSVLMPTTAASNTSDVHIVNVSNSHLPAGVDHKVFRRSFVSSLIQFWARQKNPWAVPSKLAVTVMQNAWDICFDDVPYEITTTSVVYRLVSIVISPRKISNILCRQCNASPTHGEVQLGQLLSWS
jgi:hypothetical protein